MAGSSPRKWKLIWPFFYILFLHSVAIFFFTRGFLLTRTELSSFSNCTDLSQASSCHHVPFPPIKMETNSSTKDDRRCWTKPAVERVVIIIIDALRFDFVAPNSFFGEPKPWMDKLQVLQRSAFDEGSSARIFKAIADPPTTTLQRLKGLTTGGLPTFIDVGNSFGAPAITEDNLIYQLVRNGKRVLMMGDDTWLPLFPDHFYKSYPFPSFNVKDLHTVDNGVIDHLFPYLYREEWDVLIAHFLGVDHAGHIFGVDTTPMVQKLEQYNVVLEEVIKILKNQSGPGDLHEKTLLLVMGDHGQTLNGDHGGGTAEEVETSLFAMSMRTPPSSISSILDASSCKSEHGKKLCISSIEQIDFAVTIAALLGVPFPFGSIGRINPELYALSAGTWDGQSSSSDKTYRHCSNLEMWMRNYVDVLCINCWQVKRYIDLYSASSAIGFHSEDLLQVADLYAQAQANWSDIENEMDAESCEGMLSVLQGQIGVYSNYLQRVAELARSKWTEFDMKMMGLGLCILLASLLVQIFSVKLSSRSNQVVKGNSCYLFEESYNHKILTSFILSVSVSVLVSLVLTCQFSGIISLPNAVFALREETVVYLFGSLVLLSVVFLLMSPSSKANTYGRSSFQKDNEELSPKNALYNGYKSDRKVVNPANGGFGISLRCMSALFLVTIRACSFLSNSYILEERKVTNFLLATTGVLNFKYSFMKNYMIIEAAIFLLLNLIIGFVGDFGLSKYGVISIPKDIYPTRMLGIDLGYIVSVFFTEIGPFFGLALLAFFLYRSTSGDSSWWIWKYIFRTGILLSYMLVAVHWGLESNTMAIPVMFKDIGRNIFPRMVYALGFGLLILLAVAQMIGWNERTADHAKNISTATSVMLSAWGPTILILSGRQGPFLALVSLFGGWSIIRLQKVALKDTGEGKVQALICDPLSITQWSLLGVCLFFCTGHWCTFDGLRYGAAFIGFDDFNVIRQGILLAIDTFGVSHILPIFGLPLLVAVCYPYSQTGREKTHILLKLVQVFLIYGLITAFTATFTTICAVIQRRHLMVWGLFAPKYVFDALGLILTDVFICLAALYYF